MSRSETDFIMASGCFEIMADGTRNAKRQLKQAPPGLCFNLCGLETSHLSNDAIPDFDERVRRKMSTELRYSCLHWWDYAKSCDEASDSSDEDGDVISTRTSSFLGSILSLFWLEALSLGKALTLGRDILLDIQQSNSKVSQTFITKNLLLTYLVRWR